MAANVELVLSCSDQSQTALSIPVVDCQRFSKRPLAWLRYVGFTIYGSEGYISTSPGGKEVNYYQPNIRPGIYYYISQNPAFLLDPDLMDDRTSNESVISSRGNFGPRLTSRDGTSTCCMTSSRYWQACHIVPHAKGNRYITNLANQRDRAGELHPPFDNIDDTRNGILLSPALHGPFGTSDIAFLHTPNFAMTVNDVDLVMQPNSDRLSFLVHPSVAEKRLTIQHFATNDPLVLLAAPHNSDARTSNSSEWPPDLIFDVAYGYAALKTWGVSEFVEFAQELTKNVYYDDGDNEVRIQKKVQSWLNSAK